MLKDPYIFDMLTFTDQYNERDAEKGLIKHVEKFLIEMGAGFAFMGRQYHIEVSGDDYYIDILMYNTFLHRYLVIELKGTEFVPEYRVSPKTRLYSFSRFQYYAHNLDSLNKKNGMSATPLN